MVSPNINQLSLTGGSLLERLAFVNLSLFLFNLIPAFPMDGGRILRALLATKMDYARATQTAATFGQGFALIFGIIGLFSNPFFLFIALFVWIGAGQESSSVQIKRINWWNTSSPGHVNKFSNAFTCPANQRCNNSHPFWISTGLSGSQRYRDGWHSYPTSHHASNCQRRCNCKYRQCYGEKFRFGQFRRNVRCGYG